MIARRIVAAALGMTAALVATGSAGAVVEGAPGFTTTSATKFVVVVERTDLADAPAASCGPATAPVLVSETSTSSVQTTDDVAVGPATIFIGDDQTVEYHVVAGEIDTTTLVTTTVTLHQTWQGHAAGVPCPTKGVQEFTATTASQHVVAVERTDLPDLPAAACDAAPVATRLIDETAATDAPITSASVFVGPQNIFIGPELSLSYEVISGEIDTRTLVTNTTTIQQTWQGRAAGAPCSGTPDPGPITPAPTTGQPTTVAAVAVTTTPTFTG